MKRGQRGLSSRRDGITDSRSKIHARHHGSHSVATDRRGDERQPSRHLMTYRWFVPVAM
jgi:hypothetical protein